MAQISSNNQAKVGKGEWLRKHAVPLLMLLLVIAITVGLFLYRGQVAKLGNYGYLGAFVISLVANATIILPMPGFLLLFALGAVLNPLLVGLAGGTGGTLGEMTSYLLGFSGRGVVQNRKWYDRAVRWLKRWGVGAIFVFAAFPLPLDVLGMVAGLLRFPFWKFFLACWLGKTVKYMSIALAGAWGFEAILRFFGW